MNKMLVLGKVYKPYGRLAAVMWSGERMYLFINKWGVVALMPAGMFEEAKR